MKKRVWVAFVVLLGFLVPFGAAGLDRMGGETHIGQALTNPQSVTNVVQPAAQAGSVIVKAAVDRSLEMSLEAVLDGADASTYRVPIGNSR